MARPRSTWYPRGPGAPSRPVTAQRGEVYHADPGFDELKGVLVVSWNPINELLHPVVAFITSTERERSLDTYVVLEPPEANVRMRSFILCHDIWDLGD